LEKLTYNYYKIVVLNQPQIAAIQTSCLHSDLRRLRQSAGVED